MPTPKPPSRPVPLGKLPTGETAADRRAVAFTLTTPAGQQRAALWAEGVPNGTFLHHGKARKVKAALARQFWKVGKSKKEAS